MSRGTSLVPLDAVLCTDELNRRPTREPDHATENRALVALAQALADSPHTVLQTLVETILEVLGADSAGVSLLSEDEQSFCWPAIAGAWQPHLGVGTPRNFGPCGDVLDCNAPLLFKRPERRYAYLLPTMPPAEECLVVPFHLEGKAVGTIWAIAHDALRKFDAENLRLLKSLGKFAAAAHQSQSRSAHEQRLVAARLEEAVQSAQAMEKLNAELHASEQAVRRSEGELRDFVENAAIGLHWVGPDGTILWANQTELDLLGYTREEYVGQSITDFHADQPVIADILARLTGGETLHDQAARLRRKDGSIRHVLINTNAFFQNGKFVHSRCFTRDITERKQAEEALHENEWRLRYAMESAGLTFVEVDLARGEARTAENFAAVMGYSSPPEQEADVTAGVRALLEHVVPQDRLRVNAALQKFTAGTPVGKIEYRVLGDNGIERWIESRWSIQLGLDGKSPKSIATNLDITELKQVGEALRISEERGRLALESAELGTFNIDPATNTLKADQRFQGIFGVPAGRVDYAQAFAIVHPEDRAGLRDAVAAATRPDDPVPFAMEYRVIHPDGAVRWVFAKGRGNFVQEGSEKNPLSLDGTVADITERKLAEAALRESEAFNRSIVDSSPDCIKVLDLDGNLLSMHNGKALLGIEDIRPFLNKSWVAFWEGDDRLAAQAAVTAAALGGAGNFVGFFRTLRAEPKWWDVRISPILDEHGKPERLLAISRDMTERRQREMNLEFLASVSDDLVRWTNVDDMMRTVGAKMSAYLRLSLCAFAEIDETAEQVVINHDWHREDVPSLIGVHRLNDFVEGEFIRTARAGEIIVVRDTATDPRTDPEKFAALKIASFVCAPLIQDEQWRFALCLYRSVACDWRQDEIELARELTARIWARLERLQTEKELRESEKRYRRLFDLGRRSEEALRISEERYRNLFSSMDEGYCIIEMIFDEHEKPVDWRFLEVNPAFAKLTGVHDAVGKRMRELVPDHEAYWFETYGKVALTGEAVRFVNEAKALEGRWFDLYAFKVGQPDSRKVAILFNNITERRHAEKALRDSAVALADLDRRKDEFLAMLGHELRNPLAPISNAVHLLRLQKSEDPIQQQARNIIERQVGQLTRLVDDLLDISRINTGRVQLRHERIVVSGIVERAVETAQPLIVQHGHQLTVSLPPQPIWLHADAARLEQIVVNLLTNAAKYTDEGGHIWLAVEQEGDVAVLRVRDTGIGIAPELLPRIFDLFTQAERSLDRSKGGLGIGLSLVQRLVELHGGNVAATSVLGRGSEFVVRLPILQSSPTLSPAVFSPPVPQSEKLCGVLVVDDNVDAAQSLAMLLGMLGHEVRMAFDGPSALEDARKHRPDLMLLDIGLPGLNGFEVAQRIRQQPAHKDIVLVAMTGYGQEADRKRSYEAGFDHHLAKPADFAELQQILATVSKKATVTTPS